MSSRARGAEHRPEFSVMDGVREYAEGMVVELVEEDGRPHVVAFNQGGYDSTAVDLLDLVAWLRRCRPDLLEGKS